MKSPRPQKRLDKWLAKHVMGWKWELRYFAAQYDPTQVSEAYMWVAPKGKITGDADWSPSSYILESFEVVDKLFGMGYDFELECYQNIKGNQVFRAIFRAIDKQQEVVMSYGDFREQAISLAARRVIENRP